MAFVLIVYKVVNLINNKIYIGKTVNKFSKRKSQHKYSAFKANSNTYFHKAIRKHGWDNFEWEIIDKANDNDELCEKEIYWINFYNSTNNNLGYNLTGGGEGVVGFTFSDESIERMRVAQLGKKRTKEHRKSISEGLIGREVSEETRDKISEAQRGKPRKTKGENHGCAKLTNEDVIEIKKLLMDGESQRAIANTFNVSRNTITFIQKGKTWTHIHVDGFVPFDKDNVGEGNPSAKLSEEQVIEIKKLLKNGKISQSEIAKIFNVSKHIISRIKTGKTWKHVEV